MTYSGGGSLDSGYMKQIHERVLSAENGMVFTTSDFSNIESSDTVCQSLNRLVNSGILHQVFRGVFEKTKYGNLLEEYVATDPNAVANALARSYHWTIAPYGNTALYCWDYLTKNLLFGLILVMNCIEHINGIQQRLNLNTEPTKRL